MASLGCPSAMTSSTSAREVSACGALRSGAHGGEERLVIQRSRAFRTKPEAERYRSALLVAQQSGEAFDEQTGVPVSWLPLADQVQAHEWARRWLPGWCRSWCCRRRLRRPRRSEHVIVWGGVTRPGVACPATA